MDVAALLAPPPAVAAHPAVLVASRLGTELLAPHAAVADDPDHGVERAHLDELARHGLLSAGIPEAEGGLGADARTEAETIELTSGACGATWFVTTQHDLPQALSRGPLRGLDPDAVALGPAAHRHRRALANATTSAGIAIAHVRRTGPPAVRAEPAGTGWAFHGGADWCTGWGLIDMVMIAACTVDDRFVLALLPAADRPGLRAGAPLPLSVMAGTRTVALEMDGLAIAADDVLAIVDIPPWRAHDAARTANTRPATIGLARRVLEAMAELAVERDRPEAGDTACAMAERLAHLRGEAYALAAEPVMERIAERITLRAEVAELTVRAAHALVAARAGSALLVTSPEQRWAREAAFHLVQAQTAAVRVAQLAAFRA